MSDSAYLPGDIVGVPANHLLARLCHSAFEPHTNLFHWLIIYEYVPDERDYIILESIPKGVAIGRLSWYKGNDYRVFRPNVDDPTVGKKVCQELTRYGRNGYDWLVFITLPFDCLAILVRQIAIEHRLHPIRPSELPYRADHRLTCTEAANLGWTRVGYSLVPAGVFPLPAAFIEAVRRRRLKEVTVNDH
jgi:hypothetical protein